ncbi:MAG: glycine cleavage system protein T [Bacteroidetes bacterium SW_11_45_7]|nr:MAG: glycine cleavage system protein T [Bacteroidetes bacterium SW_11_45_7]
MKETPLTPVHREAGAKMVEFAGFSMPVMYSSIQEEHDAVRNHAGIFDVSHMGEFVLKGDNALPLIQKVTTNDASTIEKGHAQYTCMTNEQGGIIDDLLIYHLEDGNYMMVVNAANMEKDWEWINKNNTMGAELYNISEKTALFAIQGPKAKDTLQKLTEVDLSGVPFYGFTKGELRDLENVLISGTGYTGEPGFELYLPIDQAPDLWKKILSAGDEYDIRPVGLGARDTLRLEAGLFLHGNDMDETTTPIEARLGWITKLDKDFIGKDVLAKQKEEGTSRRLTAFELQEKGIPRYGYDILDKNDNQIGTVTSGTMSPTLKKAIGLGYVQKPHHKVGTEFSIAVRKKRVKAQVVKLPFYKK